MTTERPQPPEPLRPSDAGAGAAGLPPPPEPPVDVRLLELEGAACPYLPGRVSLSRGFFCASVPGSIYHAFMNAGFRRSGSFIYQPACPTCRECRPIRVPVEGFAPSKSQRRCARRNADLTLEISKPEPTREKHDLYARYLAGRHDGAMSAAWDDFKTFLYDSPADTVETTYRDAGGRLLAVGICDLCSESLSSVYFYFDPAEARRGLGIFGVLREIEIARRLVIPHYYPGYYISGCAAMEYKALFRPCEILGTDGVWRPAA